MSDSAHVTAVKNQAKLREKSAQRRRIVNGKLEHYAVEVSAQEGKEAVAAAIKAESEKFNIGDLVPGKGIFMGTWTPKDREGISLCKTFNVFAAPEGLTNKTGEILRCSYQNALNRIAGLENWHDHAGTSYASDRELLEDLKNDKYNGGWFIPPIELLCGYNIDDNQVQPDNFKRYNHTGAFSDAMRDKRISNVFYYCYWSSSTPDKNSLATRCFTFSDGNRSWEDKTKDMRCHPVRLELKP